ncbi:hypothetical protein NEOKW01_0015 [Nematocida sp. AWRm80]|nr:hypothetical protein NEOKW01_0015 [Nematocida sp. AWRm80]
MTGMGARTRMNQEEKKKIKVRLEMARMKGLRGVDVIQELPEGKIRDLIEEALVERKITWTDETWEEDKTVLEEEIERKEREAEKEKEIREQLRKEVKEEHEAETRELRKRIEELKAKLRKEDIRDRQKGVKCYNCQRYGHIAINCRIRNNENSQNNKNGSSYLCSTLTPKESKHWSPDVDREISGSESEDGWTTVQTNREILVRVERKRVYDNNRP